MQKWKDVISSRLIDREEKYKLFDVLVNQIGKKLDSLLKELRTEYNIACSFEEVGDGIHTSWVIKIEDEKNILDLQTAAHYYKSSKDLNDGIVKFILDRFEFSI